MSRRRKATVSTTQETMPDGTTATVTHIPEGMKGNVDIGEGRPAGETYPESETTTMTEEELKAKEAEEIEAREKRAKRATGPRKLNPNEKKVVEYFLNTYIGENDPADKVVSLDELHPDMKPFFYPTLKDNVIQRGVFNAVYDPETKNFTGVNLTAGGLELYMRLTRKASVNGDQEPTGRVSRGVKKDKAPGVSRATKYPDNLRLRILADGNPRQVDSHGYHAFNLYENGMTYNQYLKKAYDKTLKSGSSGAEFSGPKRVHWDWDINHGHIGLYHDDVPEFLDDGSPNPNFWYVNMSPSKAEPQVVITTTE
jgi:hypothetical protein